MNKLYFGDSLDVLKELHQQHREGFIDLIYIDPPFNSKRNYNILFEDVEMKDVKAQKEAFADTWSNIQYKETLHELQELDLSLFNFLKILDSVNISKSAVSYLTTMAIRILYIHKVLKDTGSFYLHCDPNMSHYLKLVCDLIFGEKNFRNEIIWQRTNAHNDAKQGRAAYGNITDTILYYSKSAKTTFNTVFLEHNPEYIDKFYRYVDSDGRKYRLGDLTAPGGAAKGNPHYEFLGITRYWRYSKENMLKLYEEGRIIQNKEGNVPAYKRYIDETEGVALQNLWTDIKPLQAHEKEKLGYPTQKPLLLLERIINVSSKEGDLVADFFCGCGTTVSAAQKLNRKWLGADISHLAIGLIEKRLADTYGPEIKKTYEVEGFPKDLASARQLAAGTGGGRLKFQDWIIEAKLGGVSNPKKSADGGWDGHLTFEMPDSKENALIEVKSGNVNVKNLREFIQVVKKSNTSIGAFVCFKDQVTRPMQEAAKDEGYFAEQTYGTRYPFIQIITVEDLLDGKNIDIPVSLKTTFKTAKKAEKKDGEQGKLF